MNRLEELNAAMDYIEGHLREPLDLSRVARIAGCSEYQFLRMFPYLAGISLREYVRLRRMSRAAEDLVSEDIQIVDLAARYGYESPTSFTRAFRAAHGIAPQAARKTADRLVLYPRLEFHIYVKGAQTMDYRIETLPSFRAVGIPDPNWSKDGGTPSEKATAFWTGLGAGVHRVLDLMDGSRPTGLLGLGYFDAELGAESYMAAVATQAPRPEGMVEYEVPEATYAVFSCQGPMPKAMTDLWHRIMSEWLPSSGFEWDHALDMERYLTANMTTAESTSEVWLPVKKKA